MKKIIALLLTLIMLVTLAACGGGKDDSTADGGSTDSGASAGDSAGSESTDGGKVSDTLNISVTSDSGTMAPHNIGIDTFAVVSQIMEPLWDVTIDGEVIMTLCESVDVVSDTQQTLHLRQGVKFHNGNDFKANDVLFSMRLYGSVGMSAPRVQTVDLEATNVIDDYTLDLRLNEPTIANWTVLSQCLIYDEESYDDVAAASTCIGTGPYKQLDYVPGSEIKLERNEEYWGTPGHAKYITCKVLAEDAQRVNALETGLIDIASIATTDYEYVNSLEELDVVGNYTGNMVMVNYNFGPNSALYQNLEARKAIAHAIDRQAILNTVYLGHGKIMDCALLDYCFDFEDRFNNLSEQYSRGYDLEYAKQLAESSGLAGQTIQILTNGAPTDIRVAEMLQGMLSQIGVTLEITNYDSATVYQLMYSMDSDWELQVSPGIAPNRRCGDLLLNGVRYNPQLAAEGSFENNMEYLSIAPLCMSTQDEQELSDLLYKMIKWFQDELLAFPMFDIENFIGVTSKVDPSSIRLSIGSSGIRYAEVVLK